MSRAISARQQADLLRLGVAAEIQRHHARLPGKRSPEVGSAWAESILPSQIDWRRVLAAEVSQRPSPR